MKFSRLFFILAIFAVTLWVLIETVIFFSSISHESSTYCKYDLNNLQTSQASEKIMGSIYLNQKVEIFSYQQDSQSLNHSVFFEKDTKIIRTTLNQIKITCDTPSYHCLSKGSNITNGTALNKPDFYILEVDQNKNSYTYPLAIKNNSTRLNTALSFCKKPPKISQGQYFIESSALFYFDKNTGLLGLWNLDFMGSPPKGLPIEPHFIYKVGIGPMGLEPSNCKAQTKISNAELAYHNNNLFLHWFTDGASDRFSRFTLHEGGALQPDINWVTPFDFDKLTLSREANSIPIFISHNQKKLFFDFKTQFEFNSKKNLETIFSISNNHFFSISSSYLWLKLTPILHRFQNSLTLPPINVGLSYKTHPHFFASSQIESKYDATFAHGLIGYQNKDKITAIPYSCRWNEKDL